MTAQPGKKLQLAIGNGATPTESFSPVGGLTQTRMQIDQETLLSADAGSGPWARRVSAAGIRNLRIEAEGVFTDSAAEERLRAQCFAGAATSFQLLFGNGDRIDASFLVAAYEQRGAIGEPQSFRVTLQNAGPVSFVAA